MTYRKAVCRGTVATAALILMAALSGGAQAQDTTPPPNQTDTSGPIEKVTVTGSHIKRRRESTSLPVDVITSEDLEKDGAPTIVEVAKALPVSSGVIGDTNQFDARAQGSEGTASINLRGLGPTRTLILLNGRRLALNPFGLAGQGIVDTNVIPVAALERIEVLKDGAAATYGSDAIGGVVNFITRKNYDGLNLAGDWRFVKDANGDYSARGVYGYDTDDFNWLLSAGFQHRSELDALDRKFTQTEYVQNPEGGWTAAGSPGSLLYLSPGGTLRRDAGCAALGGYPGFSGTTPVCQMQYIDFDNLQEEEDKLQVYSSVNYDWSPGHRVFADALYATTDVPRWETTPLYAILSTPSAEEQAQSPANPAAFANRFWISPTNPGLIDYVAQNVAADPTLAGMLASGAAYLAPAARPIFLGGNPTMPGGASQVAQREYEALRFTGGFEGDFNENLSYELSTTYSRHEAYRNGFDTLTNRFALALKGLGGPACDKEPNTPGIQGPGGGAAVAGANGCQYWNPFSNAIQRNVLTGQTNPQYNAAVANDIAVLNWFQQELTTNQEASLWVVDGLISGNSGIELWGGPIEFAVGGQYRHDTFKSEYGASSNALENPCVSSPDYFNDVCPGNQRGPFVFLGVATPADLDGSVYAAFGELAIPLLEDLEINVAARFEDYGGETGSTFDPKISAKWTINNRIALRGSAGSTFRGPPLVQLANTNITSLQSVLGTFRAVDIGGNPDLEPEAADTFSVGAILTLPWFRGTIDYWGFDFENPIIAEPLGGMVQTLFPNGASAVLPNNCLVYPALAARFTFSGACLPGNISRVQTFYVNGSPVTTKGIDVLGEFPIDDNWQLSVSATHVDQYKVAPISVEGVQVQAGFEASGLLNYQTTVYPIPKFKGSLSIDYDTDVHFVRFTMNYIDSYTDQRTAPFAANAYRDATGAFFTQNAGKVIDDFVTFDVNYRWMVMEDMSIAIAVDNIFNEYPPLARLDLSYDPLTHSTLGRTFKLGVRKEF